MTADFPFQLPGSLYDHSCGVVPSRSGQGFDLVLAGGAFGYSYGTYSTPIWCVLRLSYCSKIEDFRTKTI